MRALGILAFLALACGGSDAEPAMPKGEDRLTLGDRPPDRRAVGPEGTDDDGDDGLQVEGLKGHIEPYDIEKSIKRHSKELSNCYEGRLAGRRYVGGSVELAYVVSRDGAVKRVYLKKSDLGNWGMERCLLDVSRGMKFAKPKGGNRNAEFSVPLDFTPRTPALWWGESRVTTEVGDKALQLAECDERAGVAGPKDLWVTAYVGRLGKISSVGFAAPSGGLAEPWASCAAEVVETWELSDPRGRVAKLAFQYTP